MNLEEYIELTCLKPDAVLADIHALCKEASDSKFSTVCVPPLFVKKAKEFTAGKNIAVSTVIGFPLGYNAIEAKVAEIVLAIIDGADEVEIVINTSAVKTNDWQYLAGEINTVMPIIRNKGRKVSVILETALLTITEIIKACDIYGVAGVDFVKAGTGFIDDNLIVDNVKLLRKHLAAAIQLKIAEDAENYGYADELIAAGANRLCINNSLQRKFKSLQPN